MTRFVLGAALVVISGTVLGCVTPIVRAPGCAGVGLFRVSRMSLPAGGEEARVSGLGILRSPAGFSLGAVSASVTVIPQTPEGGLVFSPRRTIAWGAYADTLAADPNVCDFLMNRLIFVQRIGGRLFRQVPRITVPYE